MASMQEQQPRLTLHKLLANLVTDGMVAETDATKIKSQKRSREHALLHPLVYLASLQLRSAKDKQLLTETLLSQWLADMVNLPLVQIDPLRINVVKTTEMMSYPFAKRNQILCVDVNSQELKVACAEPYVNDWVSQLEHVTRRKVKRVFVKPSDIARYIAEFYTVSTSVAGASASDSTSHLANFEQLLELGKLNDPEANDQHVVNIVDWLLQYAFEQRASDIHIEPRREIGRVRFRIDGVLHEVYQLPAKIVGAVTSRLKILGRMNVAEKRKPQDGRIKTKRHDGSEVELRLSTLPTAFGEKLVLRIFDPDVLLKGFDELGLQGEALRRWEMLLTQAHGIVLVTGPTGSGKTTTLYSSLKRLANDEVNVSTIEDPIEMVEDSFNQTQVQHNIELDFAKGLRTLMRQDPDIIMVGEIRDIETAQMASQAALTGHLVLSTLHTNDAAAGVTRLLDLGLPAYMIRTTVVGVMAQRLVRTLCENCKEPDVLDKDVWRNVVAPWKLPPPKHIYKPVGCLECRDTGYIGRQGIYEIFPLSPKIKSLITDDCDAGAIADLAMQEGMHTLRLSGAHKVAQGLTTIDEVLRVVPL